MKSSNGIIVTLCFCFFFILSACEKTDDGKEQYDITWDTTVIVNIILDGNSITVDPPNAVVSGSTVTVRSGGTYHISGSLANGQIVVNSDYDGTVKLLFDNVNISCSSGAPVYIKDAEKTIIELTGGSVNVLTDSEAYSTKNGEPNAALFSNSNLIITGAGSLIVTGNYNDGISSDDGLIIKRGTIRVTSKDDGIRGKDYLFIEKGDITVHSNGDGLLSDNDESSATGYISIDSGRITIVSKGDGISAQSRLLIKDGDFTITSGGGSSVTLPSGASAKGLKATESITIEKGTFSILSADDGIHSHGNITINGGTISIATSDDAVHGEVAVTINGGTTSITQSREGIESAAITVNNGSVSLIASDDGFNATKGNRVEYNDGSSLSINGGFIVVNVSNGDGLDSNGNILITSGTVIVHGPRSQPEVGFDCNGTFSMNGGFFLATGPNAGHMIEVPGASSLQYFVKITVSSTLAPSTLLHIQDAAGNNIVTYQPVRTIYYLVLSTPDFKNGLSCSIFTGGSSTGTLTDGIYIGGTYSGGTLRKNFTISSKLTNISF